jgi:hypothetical protein|tara:strand:+ start:2028 stop:2261 length:234 start_codon:yes stop_codon:yes gene_type:complete
MKKDSTLQYQTSYDKRLKAYNSQSIKPKEKQEGLMGRKAEKAEEQIDNIDVQLQKAFNMIRDNNRILLESANEKKDN